MWALVRHIKNNPVMAKMIEKSEELNLMLTNHSTGCGITAGAKFWGLYT